MNPYEANELFLSNVQRINKINRLIFAMGFHTEANLILNRRDVYSYGALTDERMVIVDEPTDPHLIDFNQFWGRIK